VPRITKIRVVGNKYDNFKKCHENTVFDLTKQGEPDHTLLTLENGSGKGVLMQLISQIVLPNTRWGKNDGNKITGMFFNRTNQFNPYTFHVLLEWKLDTVPDKWLITGICITAAKKTSGKEEEKEEEKIGVNFFLYTHEHYAGSFYTLENIPVYHKEEKRTIDYDTFETFLMENKRDFRKFSESQSRSTNSDYYKYLDSHGIYRSEWSILKLINRVEGGVGDYFSKAKDNKGIFDEYIIPAISENLNNQFEENKNALKDMFRSNISITKNLPVLISREADYRNLISMLSPLIQDAEGGISYEGRKERCIVDGNNLYSTLLSLQNNILNELKTWEREKEKSEEIQKELLFEKDNLGYAKQLRLQKEYGEEKAEEEKELSYVRTEVEELKEERKRYEINKLIIPLESEKKKKEAKQQEIENLVKSLDLEDINKEIEKVEDTIKEKWVNTEEQWKVVISQHSGYEGFLKASEGEIKNRIKALRDKQQDIKVKLQAIEDKKAEINKKEKELSKEFDPFRIAYPELLSEEIEKEAGTENRKLEELITEISKLEEEIKALQISCKGLELQIENHNKEIKKAESQYAEQKQEEEKIFHRVVELCKLNPEEETYSESWLQNKNFEILKHKEEKKLKLKELNKELWENNIDLSLNTKDYWIANNDIEILKAKIEALGVKVVYGTQFLALLKDEERIEQLKNCPMLPFALVIADIKDWETISKNLAKDIFIRSMVPLYIRTEMGQTLEANYRLPDHDGLRFIENSGSFDSWKENLGKREFSIREAAQTIENSTAVIDKVIVDISHMLKTESSKEIDIRLNKILSEKEKSERLLSTSEVKILNLQEKLKVNKEVHLSVSEKIKALEFQSKKLKDFIEFKNEAEAKLKEEKEEKEKLNSINRSLEEMELEEAAIRNKIQSEYLKYEGWRLAIKSKLKDIKEIIKDAELREQASDNNHINMEPDYESTEEDSIFEDIAHRKALNAKLEEKNFKISVIRTSIEELEERIEEILRQLRKLDQKWEVYRLENQSLDAVELEFDRLDSKLNLREKYAAEKQGKIDKLSGLLQGISLDIKRTGDRITSDHNRTPKPWENINLQEKEFKVKKDIEDNENYLKETMKILLALTSQNISIGSCISDIKHYDDLQPGKGKTTEFLLDKVKGNEKNEVDQWIQSYKTAKESIRVHTEKAQRNFEIFLEELKANVKDEILKHKIKELIGEKTNIANFSSNKDSFVSMSEHAQREINQVSSDKVQAEQAKEQWTSRAARQVIKIAECLKEMVNKMVYINENGHAFKLVRLRGEDLLPREENDIKVLLNEYFIECIEKLEKAGADFDNLEDKTLDNFMSDRSIFSKALRGKYPNLEVYKMTEKNEFLYARPANHHYATWGAVNSGEGDAPEGSGGQTLSINTFIIMMLMNYKKKTLGNENPWTVLMLDNPFGKASGAHVLDPIFTIADKLNFQILAFAAPEIIKTEISERFPILWALKINSEEENGKIGSVIGRVVHGGRVRI
jgi:hypothetical protein